LGGPLANIRRILREDIINDDTNMINMKPAFPVVDGWTVAKRGGQGDGMFKALLLIVL
jgi:hypothetical protein